MINCAGIVLCGGHSRRMGTPKWSLPFGPELMLARVVHLLGQAVGHIVVVAAPNQALPDLPGAVHFVRDRREGCGPLEGLRAGLAAVPAEFDAAYATGCDVPLLVPAFVTRMIELCAGHEIAVPIHDGRHHPLAAVYRRSVLAPIEMLLDADRLRPALLFDLVSTRRVAADELTEVDPELTSLWNINHPADYLAALARAGFTAPSDILAALANGPPDLAAEP